MALHAAESTPERGAQGQAPPPLLLGLPTSPCLHNHQPWKTKRQVLTHLCKKRSFVPCIFVIGSLLQCKRIVMTLLSILSGFSNSKGERRGKQSLAPRPEHPASGFILRNTEKKYISSLRLMLPADGGPRFPALCTSCMERRNREAHGKI